MHLIERLFDNHGVSLDDIPDARPARDTYLQVSGGRRVDAFQPVVYRESGRWHFGVVIRWIQALDSPWMAQIRSGERDARGTDTRIFDYLDDGAILPLQLTDVQGIPVLRPMPPKRQ